MRLPFLPVCLFLLLFLLSPDARAQGSFTVSGYVRVSGSNEALIGATVSVPELRIGATSDERGFYTLQLPDGSHTLQVTYIGYEPTTRPILVDGQNHTVNLLVAPASSKLREVIVEANSLRQKLNNNLMSVETLTTQEAKLLPAIFGEVDLIKTLQLKPGVQSGGEGSSGLYVRGGGPDQNLVLLDDAVVYNASHLFGFFSVFNPDAVESVELYKGGFPAQFGGRLSSVVDVKLNNGNNERIRASGGLGLIASRLTVDGPLIKDKASFIVSGRRTYFDIFTRQINRIQEGKEDFSPIPDYYFYDLNGKVNYKLGEKDELFLSGYFGRDFFGFNDEDFQFRFDWGNKVGALRWQHRFNPRFQVNTTFTGSSYQYNINNKIDVFSFNLSSDIRDLGLKTDFNLVLDKGHTLAFGAMATRHAFTIGRLNFDSDDNRLAFKAGSDYDATEAAVYVSDDFQINSRFSLNYGLRLSAFGSGGKTYTALEPRASGKYNLTVNTALKGSYASMMQYIHLVANSGASLPTDIWYPSNDYVKPQRSQQVAAGISHLFADGRYMVTNELYYKWMHRQIDFRDGANLFVNDKLEEEFLFGKGESYGNEVYLEKIKGRTTGWIGYTLSWTYRQFDGINEGRRFPTRYDRRHDLSVVLLHKLSKRIHLTGAFVYSSGNAYSLPVARFAFQDVEGKNATVVPVYNDRNSFRLDAFHRLDLGLVLKLNSKFGESDLMFNAYNTYNRRNPYFVYFEQVKDKESDETLGFRAKQVSLFPVIPSVTYNFKF
ncbi:TonB-dependent receptor [Pontibacter sp. JH31]|uniref:TonB-dependent receptor n=1 Tax=Pontibacter aquaedesilientis TaxID=2766980 RepID=A0ABR7XGI9_9BACT|nr:TonB-dependent receptor [Pontibacter aquaedesilientis]MBD1397051.1 TonB-dependent receptor [Pontibacter aquaedesilientis]